MRFVLTVALLCSATISLAAQTAARLARPSPPAAAPRPVRRSNWTKRIVWTPVAGAAASIVTGIVVA